MKFITHVQYHKSKTLLTCEVKVKVQGKNCCNENLLVVIARPWFKISSPNLQSNRHWTTRSNFDVTKFKMAASRRFVLSDSECF